MSSSADNAAIIAKAQAPSQGSSMPGFLPASTSGMDMSKMKFRYGKFDLDDDIDVAELENIETRAIQGAGVYVCSVEKFMFMDRCFVLIRYMEENAK